MSLLFAAISLLAQPPVANTLPDTAKPVPRDDFWVRQHQHHKSQLAQRQVDIAFLGDSITEGWNGKGRRVWQAYYAKRRAVNLGLSGDRTQHLLWRLNDGLLESISPKVIVVMIGTNNSGSDTPSEIRDGTKAIVNKLKQNNRDSKVLLLAIFPRGDSAFDARRRVNQRTNTMIAQLADDERVFYLDIGRNFLGRDETIPRQLMSDSVHLTERGYSIWAKSMEAKIRALLKEKKPDRRKR